MRDLWPSVRLVGGVLVLVLLVWRFNALTRRGFMPAAPGHAALH